MTQAKLLKDIVYNRIRDLIILGSIPMGAKLSETVLAERLHVTKAPVRDAIKRLQSEGLVIIKPKSGTFVFSTDRAELAELLEFRFVVESEALKLAYQRNKVLLIQELRSILDRMSFCLESDNHPEYLRQDHRYHKAIINSCDNAYFIEAYRLIASRMATIRTHLGTNCEHMKRSFKQHEEITLALENNVIDDAVNSLLCHIIPDHGAYWDMKNLPVNH